MRLLLDEMLSPPIASQLRDRGHDVVAVAERPDLRGLADAELLAAMTAERRVIATENAAHFVPLLAAHARAGEPCYGLILSSNARMPRARATIGSFVTALERELRARPDDDSLVDQAIWLTPP